MAQITPQSSTRQQAAALARLTLEARVRGERVVALEAPADYRDGRLYYGVRTCDGLEVWRMTRGGFSYPA